MTTPQKIILLAALVAALGTGGYEARQAGRLREQVQTLCRQQGALAAQLQRLQRERAEATNQLAWLTRENAALQKRPTQVLKLRGEVGKLRQENANPAPTSALGKLLTNPATKKSFVEGNNPRNTDAFKRLVRVSGLSPEQAEQLAELLANRCVDALVCLAEGLHAKKTPQEMNELIDAQEAMLREKLPATLGPDALSHYQDYTMEQTSDDSIRKFKAKLTGNDNAKEEKVAHLRQAFNEEARAALAAAGWPADYTFDSLRPMTSDQQGEQYLALIGDLYDRVAARTSAFFSPEEVEQFKEFRTKDIEQARANFAKSRNQIQGFAQ